MICCSCLNWFFTILILLLTTVLYFVYNRINYFKRYGIPYEEPHFLKGNMTSGKYLSDMKRSYNRFRTDSNPIFGFYLLFNSAIVIKDLDLIKKILVKDFDTFAERDSYHNKKSNPLSIHLFAMDEESWKEQRSKLSMAFTTDKMKYMFSTVDMVTKRLTNVLAEFANNNEEIEMKEYLARYGTDVIGNIAFGMECNSLTYPNDEFRKFCKKAVQNSVENFLGNILKINFPSIAHFLGIRSSGIDVQKFCFQMVHKIMKQRKNGYKRNDFMDLLLEMKKTKENPDGLDLAEIAAYVYIFFIADFQTTSTTMGFALYEMSLNQEIQNKARDEINEILEKYNGIMTYECLEEMIYLDQVINETLRMYPPVAELNRKAVKDYSIPDTNFKIEKGMPVIIPISIIHRDSSLYDEPDKFIPERFESEKVKTRHSMSFIPFGVGPRNCIGMRFSKMQTKLGLATLLKNFYFKPGNKLTVPIILDENALVRQSKSRLWFKIDKVETS